MKNIPKKSAWQKIVAFALLCVLVLGAVPSGIFQPLRVNAAQPIGPGTTYTLSGTTSFPIQITQNGTYTIIGQPSGNVDSFGNAMPTMYDAGSNHGIYVAQGVNATITVRDVGISTTAKQAAPFLVGGDTGTVPGAEGYVKIVPEGVNYFFSGDSASNNGSRAGIEVWMGSTIEFDGPGSITGRNTRSRAWNNAGTLNPSVIAEGKPGGNSEPNGVGEAAGIGAGNVTYSGGNVIIRRGTVVGIGGAHGAGIGGAWNNTGLPAPNNGAYQGSVLAYGGTVKSLGGEHGAGIGGACGANNNPNSVPDSAGTVVVLPPTNILSYSYTTAAAYPALGKVSTDGTVYIGDPTDTTKFSLRTEEFLPGVTMYLDLTQVTKAKDSIERFAGGILNPERLFFGITPADGILNQTGTFDQKVVFYTNAKNPKGYEYVPVEVKPVNNGMYILVPPTFIPDLEITPYVHSGSYEDDEHLLGYNEQERTDKAITIKVKNIGKAELTQVKVTFPNSPDFETPTHYMDGTSITDPNVKIKAGEFKEIKLKLNTNKDVGTYTGNVRVTADKVEPAQVKVMQYTTTVKRRGVNVTHISTNKSVVGNDDFTITVDFSHPVKDLAAAGVTIDNGFASNFRPDPAGTYSKKWKFEVAPNPGLANDTMINTYINVNAATDQYGQGNENRSQTVQVKYSNTDPTVVFNYNAEDIFNPAPPNLFFTIDANGQGSSPTTVYFGNATTPLSSKTPNEIADGVIVARAGVVWIEGVDYNLTVVGSQLVFAPTSTLDESDDYTIAIKNGYFFNENGYDLKAPDGGHIVMPFKIRLPETVDQPGTTLPGGPGTPEQTNPAKIHVKPVSVKYQGDTVIVEIYGKYFNHLNQDQLQILLPVGVVGAGTKVAPTHIIEDPAVGPEGSVAQYRVALPRNELATHVPYAFEGFLDNASFGTATAYVEAATTDWTASRGYGIFATPRTVDYAGQKVDLRIKGENIHHHLGLEIGVYADGVLKDTIPTPTLVSGEIELYQEYTIPKNTSENVVQWTFVLQDAGVAIAGVAPGAIEQGSAEAHVNSNDGFTVSEAYNTKGNINVTLEDAGGTVYFYIEGLNLHNFKPITITNDSAGAVADVVDTQLEYSGAGDDNKTVISSSSAGLTIPANKTQDDIVYTFSLVTQGVAPTPTHTLTITVKKPEIGVTSVVASPEKFNEAGGTATFTLEGKHMDVAGGNLTLVDQDRGTAYPVGIITNNGTSATIDIAFVAHTGGLRNDLYPMEVHFNGVATGLIVTIEVGPSTPSITDADANPNHYATVAAATGKTSMVTIHGNYLENFNNIQIYDNLYDRFYTVNKTGADMTATYFVPVPSIEGVFPYDIWANGSQTAYTVDIYVGVPLGTSGGIGDGGDDAELTPGHTGFYRDEYVGFGGGNKGGGFSEDYYTGFDLLEYKSTKTADFDPRFPSVTLVNQTFISREQLDLAASGAKAGAQASDKSGVTAEEMRKLGILELVLDTTSPSNSKVLEGRIYLSLDRPMPGFKTGVFTREEETKDTQKLFASRFENKNLWVVRLAHNDSFKNTLEIAALLDIKKKTNDYKLYIYRFNRKTGEYTRIENPDHYFDTSGYLHFNTTEGGDIIISDKPLTVNGTVEDSGFFDIEK